MDKATEADKAIESDGSVKTPPGKPSRSGAFRIPEIVAPAAPLPAFGQRGKLFRTTAFKLSVAYFFIIGLGFTLVLERVGENVRD